MLRSVTSRVTARGTYSFFLLCVAMPYACRQLGKSQRFHVRPFHVASRGRKLAGVFMDTMKALRRAWLVRLKNRELYCALCGCLIESRKDLNVEHYVPRSLGGATDDKNCLSAHKWCNSAKANHDPLYWNVHGYTLLANLIHAWTLHKVKFPVIKVYKSLEALK